MKSLWELKSRGVESKHLSVVPRKGRWTLPMLSLVTRCRGTGGSWPIRTKRCSLQELGLGLPPVRVWPDDFLIFHWVFAPKTQFCPNYFFPGLLPFLVWVLVYFQSLCRSVCSLFLLVSLLPSLLTGTAAGMTLNRGQMLIKQNKPNKSKCSSIWFGVH